MAQDSKKPLKIMMKSAWGPDDPTKAAFPFAHGRALPEAGHEVQIFLFGEATSLLRKSMVNAILLVGWPPLRETKGGGRTYFDFFLRSLHAGPWGHGNRRKSR
jgi:hypothetical protein